MRHRCLKTQPVGTGSAGEGRHSASLLETISPDWIFLPIQFVMTLQNTECVLGLSEVLLAGRAIGPRPRRRQDIEKEETFVVNR